MTDKAERQPKGVLPLAGKARSVFIPPFAIVGGVSRSIAVSLGL